MASASLLNVVAWFLMIGPLLQSAWVLSRGGRRLVGPHVLLALVSFHDDTFCIIIVEPILNIQISWPISCSLFFHRGPWFSFQLAVCGGLVELLARLFYVGMMNAAPMAR